MKWSGLVLGAGLLFVRGDLLSQAPVVRQPPPVDGAQAPKDPDDVQTPPVVVTQAGGGKTNGSQSGSPTGGFPTIKVETRLVNVALNVVGAKGSTGGGGGGMTSRFWRMGSCRRSRCLRRRLRRRCRLCLPLMRARRC